MERTPGSGRAMSTRDRRWPGKIRRINHAYLRQWRLEYIADDVDLLLSELVTNAIAYGDGPSVHVRVSLGCGVLRIEVYDGSSTAPQSRTAGEDQESGRGLIIVDAIVAEHGGTWGVSSEGMTTWCEVPLRTSPCLP
ncbi:ATP-binding protein [Streptomyces sp. NPDC059479]|uniref:ATP-binding protein n=1 Tax=Streptomyces sp. NPDC059479 TaxID=3346848 RepID=UPI0036A98669